MVFEALNLPELFPSRRKLQIVDLPTPGPPRGTMTNGESYFFIDSIAFDTKELIDIPGQEWRMLLFL